MGREERWGARTRRNKLTAQKAGTEWLFRSIRKHRKRGETDLQVDPSHHNRSSCSFSSEPAWGANSGAQNLHPVFNRNSPVHHEHHGVQQWADETEQLAHKNNNLYAEHIDIWYSWLLPSNFLLISPLIDALACHVHLDHPVAGSSLLLRDHVCDGVAALRWLAMGFSPRWSWRPWFD